MKTCPFCSEEIKNFSAKCEHCDGDIASVEAALQEEADAQDENLPASLLFGLVGGSAFLYGAYFYWSYGQTYLALASLAGAAFFFLFANHVWMAHPLLIRTDTS